MTKLVWDKAGRREFWPGEEHGRFVVQEEEDNMCGSAGTERPPDDIETERLDRARPMEPPVEECPAIVREHFEALIGQPLSDWQWRWVDLIVNEEYGLEQDGRNFVLVPKRK